MILFYYYYFDFFHIDYLSIVSLRPLSSSQSRSLGFFNLFSKHWHRTAPPLTPQPLPVPIPIPVSPVRLAAISLHPIFIPIPYPDLPIRSL